MRSRALGLVLSCAASGWLLASIGCGGAGLDSSNEGASSGSSSSSSGSPGGNSSGAADDGGNSSPLDDGGAPGSSSSGSSSSSGGASVDAGPVVIHADAAPPASLDPGVSPGGNFDLSVWELQEPVGSPGAPMTIASAQLEGPTGYHDTYIFTDPSDGSMTFWDPENGVTTANSNYPRSELREMTSGGAAANWMPTGTNTLSATVAISTVPDHVCVGQIHLGTGTPASTKPLLELFYYATGSIVLAIEQTPAGGNEVPHTVGTAALGAKWSYVIGLSGNTITLSIDGGAAQSFAMSSTFDQEGMYFKAGDYDQTVGTSASVFAEVHFYALQVVHAP